MLAYTALVCAALFTGAALYISMAEHPARMRLDDRAALAQWRESYARGAQLQAVLALVAALAGIAAWLRWRSNLPWLSGGLLMLVALPYTLWLVRGIDRELRDAGDGDIRALLSRWGAIHTGRTAIGAIATGVLWYGFVGN